MGLVAELGHRTAQPPLVGHCSAAPFRQRSASNVSSAKVEVNFSTIALLISKIHYGAPADVSIA